VQPISHIERQLPDSQLLSQRPALAAQQEMVDGDDRPHRFETDAGVKEVRRSPPTRGNRAALVGSTGTRDPLSPDGRETKFLAGRLKSAESRQARQQCESDLVSLMTS